MRTLETIKLSVIGLGYVGLPLAVEFAKNFKVVGFDTNPSRLDELQKGHDSTLEVDDLELTQTQQLSFTSNLNDIKGANVFIVTVPTPITAHKTPDLKHLISASESLGAILKKGDIVIYESTVYPGATDEECVPILEKHSQLRLNEDFFVGYSPERINPGDKKHQLKNLTKITAGSNKETALFVNKLYQSIVKETHPVSSIKVAEAAKIIENTQRDVNIGLVNELAILFQRLDIDTEEILEAAGTKWNFLPFRPGLVGGHCIGVDPYYLTYKAQSVGYHPEIILAGRRLNDAMGVYVAGELTKAMLKKKIHVCGSKVLILGFTFKENCPDIRNTKVIDIIKELGEYGVDVDVFDPWMSAAEAQKTYAINTVSKLSKNTYDAIIVAVAHRQFDKKWSAKIPFYAKANHVIYDLKYCLSADQADLRL